MGECTLTLLDSGLVYRNPAPHLRSIHAWHPSLARLDDGTLVCTFDLGQAVESFDYCTYVSRSMDDGQTWSAPQRLLVDPHPRRHTHSIRTGRLRDGRLIGIGGRFFRDDDEQGLVNRDTLGYVPMELFLVESRDGGQTWQGPRTIEPPLAGPSFEVAHRIVELSDGRWLAPLSTWKAWDGAAPNGMQAIALVSHDQGQSWPEYVTVTNAYGEGIISWEQSLVELSGGRLLSVAWRVQESSGDTLPSVFMLSRDGCSFGAAQPNGLTAQTLKILALRDGRIVGLYRHAQRSGLWGAVAQIEGDCWITLSDQQLWRGPAYAAQRSEAAAEDLAGLKLGYPSLVELPGGEIFAVFWCSEDCVHNIRWIRLRVD